MKKFIHKLKRFLLGLYGVRFYTCQNCGRENMFNFCKDCADNFQKMESREVEKRVKQVVGVLKSGHFKMKGWMA